MNRYAIYCTESQTKKALELGAPIKTEVKVLRSHFTNDYIFEDGNLFIFKPTAEQMTEWLEEQGIALDIHTYFDVNNKIHHYQYTVTDFKRVFNGEYNIRKEVILKAIDTALEYLSSSSYHLDKLLKSADDILNNLNDKK